MIADPLAIGIEVYFICGVAREGIWLGVIYKQEVIGRIACYVELRAFESSLLCKLSHVNTVENTSLFLKSTFLLSNQYLAR